MDTNIRVTLPCYSMYFGVMYDAPIWIIDPIEIDSVLIYQPGAKDVNDRMRHIPVAIADPELPFNKNVPRPLVDNPGFAHIAAQMRASVRPMRGSVFGAMIRCRLPDQLPCTKCSGRAEDCIICSRHRGQITPSEIRAYDGDPNWLAIKEAIIKSIPKPEAVASVA